MRFHPRGRLLLAALISCCAAAPSSAQSAATQPAPKAGSATTKIVNERIAATLDNLEKERDFPAAVESLTALFDQVIAYAPDKEASAFVEADFALRLVRSIGSVGSNQRIEWLKYLRANPTLAHTLVFAIKDEDKTEGVYQTLQLLRDSKPSKPLETYDNLTAALCVVFDQPLTRQINENGVKSPPPDKLYDYFTSNESSMYFGLKGVPTELLIYVVDSTATIDEMKWASSKYRGNAEVGKLFFDIKYDYQHFKLGAEKEVTKRGFNLPNILQYGGVCADQAYYAVSVGKSIGVPTAYTVGLSSEVGHAWVGFLQARGKEGWWNFNSGRYQAYQGVRGVVIDPQTRQQTPDAYVSLLAQLIGTKAAERQAGAAFVDAAQRLATIEKDKGNFEPKPLVAPAEGAPEPKPLRKLGVESELALTELGLRQSEGYAEGWFTIRELAKDGKLTLEQKQRWAELLNKLCGEKYPDFTLAVLTPMIESVEDAKEQDKLWDKAFLAMQRRADLAAAVRMSQAELWRKQGDTTRAGRCYEDVINRYANAGPFVLDALKKTEDLLRDSGQRTKTPLLFDQTWKKINLPSDMAPEFKKQSNWYRVGVMFEEHLQDYGMLDEARVVRAKIDEVTSGKVAKPARTR